MFFIYLVYKMQGLCILHIGIHSLTDKDQYITISNAIKITA